MKEQEWPIKLKKGIYQWNAYLTVNLIDEPNLEVFDEAVPFENLAMLPRESVLYRNSKTNQFKGRLKKTSYKLIADEKIVEVDC